MKFCNCKKLFQQEILNLKFISTLLWAAVFLQSIYLVLYYAENRRPDIFHYIDNAEILTQGKNPYLDGTARWGTVGSLFFLPFSRSLSEVQIAQIIIFASIVSIILFFKHIIVLDKQILPAVVCATLFLSPIRELFALGQINAVCLGLISASIALSKTQSQNRLANTIRYICISGMSAIAIDLKPHIFLLVSFVIYSHYLTRKLFGVTVAMLICCHVIVDLLGKRFYELDWFKVIYSQSDEYLISESKNIIGLLTLFNGNLQSVVKFSSVVLYCGIAFILTRKKMNFSNQLLITSLMTFLLPYFHFYDLLVPTLILIRNIITQKIQPRLIEWVLLFLLTIQENIYSITGIGSLVTMIIIVLLTRKYLLNVEIQVKFMNLVLPSILYFSIIEILKRITNDNFTYQAIMNTLIVIGLLSISWPALKQGIQKLEN